MQPKRAHITRKKLELPLLASLAEMGGCVVPSTALYRLVALKLGKDALGDEYDVVHARPKWVYDLQWVRHNLVKQGLMDGSKHGLWQITQNGVDRLSSEWSFTPPCAISDNIVLNETSVDNIIDGCIELFWARRIDQLRSITLPDLLALIDPYGLCLDGSSDSSQLIDLCIRDYLKSVECEQPSNLLFASLIWALSNRSGATQCSYSLHSAQTFWEELTADADFYLKLIRRIEKQPIDQHILFDSEWAKTQNRVQLEFLNEFATPTGSIDWEKLLKFNSGSNRKADDS